MLSDAPRSCPRFKYDRSCVNKYTQRLRHAGTRACRIGEISSLCIHLARCISRGSTGGVRIMITQVTRTIHPIEIQVRFSTYSHTGYALRNSTLRVRNISRFKSVSKLLFPALFLFFSLSLSLSLKIVIIHREWKESVIRGLTFVHSRRSAVSLKRGAKNARFEILHIRS